MNSEGIHVKECRKDPNIYIHQAGEETWQAVLPHYLRTVDMSEISE
jgi:hypothetical protein